MFPKWAKTVSGVAISLAAFLGAVAAIGAFWKDIGLPVPVTQVQAKAAADALDKRIEKEHKKLLRYSDHILKLSEMTRGKQLRDSIRHSERELYKLRRRIREENREPTEEEAQIIRNYQEQIREDREEQKKLNKRWQRDKKHG